MLDQMRYEEEPPFVQVYHLSPAENRASILAHGLDARRMGAAPGLAGSERFELDGVYVFDAPDEAKWWAQKTGQLHPGGLDLWVIAGRGIALELGEDGCDYIPGAVPPEQLRLRATFSAEELA